MASSYPVLGHKEIEQNLANMDQSGSMPHALLFYGPKGVGKRLMAERLARYIICGKSLQNSGDLAFDQSSEFYPQIEAGASSDFMVLEPAEGKKSISIEQVRQQVNSLSLSSDNRRVMIVDEADGLTISAANALLKTLEEPGERTHFVIISHNLSRLLPTIISRCRKFRFTALNEDDCRRVLEKNLEGDEIFTELPTLMEIANGCPGQALEISEGYTEVHKVLSNLLDKTTPCPSVIAKAAEDLSRKKLGAQGVDYLLRYCSQKAKSDKDLSERWATTYQKIMRRQQNMQEFNISPQLTLETALGDVLKR